MTFTSRTGYLTSPHFREHLTGPSHPETLSRLDFIDQRIARTDLFKELRPISPRSLDPKWVVKVHSPAYLARLRSLIPVSGVAYLDPDTPISPLSYQTALLASGGICQTLDEIFSGQIQNGFCAVRPPGHHAKISQGMGFCLINHVAVAARYAQENYGVQRIAIIDWDVHHGNGTEEIFYEDPSVFYFSVHQYPFYPGTGSSDQTGKEEGEGFTLNVPLERGSGDRDYFLVFEEILAPKMAYFKPELMIISAGFDAHVEDPLAQMEVSTEGFGRLTKIVKEMAERFCNGKILSVLEGGYHLDALAESVETHLRILLE
jgi:acetoin utilization deacetylase AcuC-like enzyme